MDSGVADSVNGLIGRTHNAQIYTVASALATAAAQPNLRRWRLGIGADHIKSAPGFLL